MAPTPLAHVGGRAPDVGQPATTKQHTRGVSPTTWLKTDDKFPEHKKVRRLTDSAYRLHHTAMCACAKDETDGFVTEEDIADMEHGDRLRKHVDALVTAKLWEIVPGGWLIHDYLDYNFSHEQLNAKRALDRERQNRKRKGPGATPVADVSQRDTRVTPARQDPCHATTTPPVTAPRPVPDPSRTRPALSLAESALGFMAEPVSNRRSAQGARGDDLEMDFNEGEAR